MLLTLRALIAAAIALILGTALAWFLWHRSERKIDVFLAALLLGPAIFAAIRFTPLDPRAIALQAVLGSLLTLLVIDSALRRIDKRLLRASLAAGAGPLAQARLIVWPALAAPAIAAYAMAAGASASISAIALCFGGDAKRVFIAVLACGAAVLLPAALLGRRRPAYFNVVR
jgi:ABC-type spermidine/putrescine transport system permease subunit I